jgi:cytochrome P450
MRRIAAPARPRGVPTNVYDPLDPSVLADPYPAYVRLRRLGPVRDAAGTWLVSTYEHVTALIRDPRLTALRPPPSTAGMPAEAREAVEELWGLYRRWLLMMDPPKHTHVRRLVRDPFGRREVERLRPRIRTVVDELLAPGVARGRMDVIAELAAPLPTRIVAELVGLSEEDAPFLKRCTEDLVGSFGAIAGDPRSAALHLRALGGFHRGRRYLVSELARRRLRPLTDLLSSLLAAEERGAIAPDELVANCLLLLGAGNETTTHLIGNGMLALLGHPDDLRRLRDDPSLMPTAVDELLRFDPPVQMTERIAVAAIELGGVTIRPGEWVRMLLAAANRDPAAFRDPDRLDVGRQGQRHLALGGGVHYCIGGALGRLEAEVAFGTLLRRAPDLALGPGEPVRRDNPTFRGLVSLPVVV